MMTDEFPAKETEAFAKASFADLPSHVTEISLRGLEGFDQNAVIDFLGGLNIIHGISGMGKSRVIERICEHSKRPFAMDVAEDELPTQLGDQPLSTGESIIMIAGIMGMISSSESCLLFDDVLQFLDPPNTITFLQELVDHKGQVILTANSYAIDRIKDILEGESSVKYINLADMHSG